ncbi:uncharacterized protein LOC133896968, partial [Phragmites australis]|uniref:uncharacterized protein LOC133896968 n=1 Tax=Phragmites australis TaxID=29695 RepID=UPI002D79FA79
TLVPSSFHAAVRPTGPNLREAYPAARRSAPTVCWPCSELPVPGRRHQGGVRTCGSIPASYSRAAAARSPSSSSSRRLHRRRPRGHVGPPAGAPGAGGLREVPRLLQRAPRVGAPGGRSESAGRRGAPALLGWPQQRRPASAVGGELLLGKHTKANAIVSFNNWPASEAVPYFEQIGPLFSQLIPMMEASPVYSVARNASGDAWKALFDLTGGFILEFDQEAMVSLSKFVDQLPSVMNQVTKGVSEFNPTPPENHQSCKNSYSVKFSVDAIEDTDIGGQIKKTILSGTHLTPCMLFINNSAKYVCRSNILLVIHHQQ